MLRRRSRRRSPEGIVTIRDSARVEGSLGEFVGHLEERIAVHEEREAFHARQALLHQAERDRHAAERERLAEHRDAMGKTLAATRDLFPPGAPPLLSPFEDYGPASRPKVARMVARLLETHDPVQPITPTHLARALSEVFREHLREPVDPAHVSVVLRRFAREGRVTLARPGTSHVEAVYRRALPGV